MKRIVFGIMVAVGLLCNSNLVKAEEKLCYVDLAKIFDEYNKTKGYDEVLEKKQADYEQKRETLVGELKELQKKLSLLSDEEKETRKKEIDDKIAKLQEFDKDTTQDLRKQRDEKVQEIFNDIKEVIDSYAKKEGYSFVLDQRALVFSNNKLDITDGILKILNKKKQ